MKEFHDVYEQLMGIITLELQKIQSEESQTTSCESLNH